MLPENHFKSKINRPIVIYPYQKLNKCGAQFPLSPCYMSRSKNTKFLWVVRTNFSKNKKNEI